MTFLDELKNRLDQEGIIYEDVMNGNNEGLAIGTGSCRPVIYPTSFGTVDEAVELCKELATRKEPAFMETFKDKLGSKEYVNQNLRLGIRPRSNDGAATRPFLDLELYVYIILDQDCGITSATVNRMNIEVLGLDEDEMFTTATDNMCFEVDTIANIMRKMMASGGVTDDVAELMAEEEENEKPMYVMTTPNRFRGASVMTQTDLLYELADTLGEDELVIMPSSIHEVIAVPYDRTVSPEHFKYMVTSTNETEVEPDERLSDNVYLYSASDGSVKILA